MADITAGVLVAQEKAKLRKVLRRMDLVLFTACAIVGLDSVAFAAEAGAQAITWLVISLVLFLIPYGMLVAELGSAFPVEGGPYEWVKMSFGRPGRLRHRGPVLAVQPDLGRRHAGRHDDRHARRRSC